MRDLLTGPEGYWFKLLSSVTRNNAKQMHVITSGIAYKIQYSNKSLQMSLLLLGEQGTGKSFVGNVVKRVIDGDRLAGMVVAANSDLLAKADKFLLGSIAESLVTYVDEAKRNRDGSSMVKLINRGGILQTQNKYEPLKQVAFIRLRVTPDRLRQAIKGVSELERYVPRKKQRQRDAGEPLVDISLRNFGCSMTLRIGGIPRGNYITNGRVEDDKLVIDIDPMPTKEQAERREEIHRLALENVRGGGN